MEASNERAPRFGRHGWLGLVLIIVCWTANWFLSGLRTHIFFAPLWLGFALAVDALVLRRTGTSIYSRSRNTFVLLFLISAPTWWLFELFNLRTGNWIYVGKEYFSDLAYFVLASLSFSTVMPAVFGATELVSSWAWVRRIPPGPTIASTRSLQTRLVGLGMASLVLVMIWPGYFYPLVWGIVFFLVEPLNQRLGRPSIFRHLEAGNWRRVVAIALGTLMCGLLWEFWNYFSYPKWTYYTPGVDFMHVFEMPLLGYIGYLPFGLELYVVAGLVLGRDIIFWPDTDPSYPIRPESSAQGSTP
ncbi:MAG: hypothetical protein R3178_00765 [Rhodothermales bacterium]|nr:hypothetical protein [Rhodothermales bacterium]